MHSGALHRLSISVGKQGLLITGDTASPAMVTSASAPCHILISPSPSTASRGFVIAFSQKPEEGFLHFTSLIGRSVQCSSLGVDDTGLQREAFMKLLRKNSVGLPGAVSRQNQSNKGIDSVRWGVQPRETGCLQDCAFTQANSIDMQGRNHIGRKPMWL